MRSFPSPVDFILRRLSERGDSEVMRDASGSVSAGELLLDIERVGQTLRQDIPRGAVVGLSAPGAIAGASAFFALILHGCVVVPMERPSEAAATTMLDAAGASHHITAASRGQLSIESLPASQAHPLVARLRDQDHPGLVLFTSGTSGREKAVLHDLTRFLRLFHDARKAYRTLAFLRFDHVGGISTLLHALVAGGSLVGIGTRTPHEVARVTEAHAVACWPVTPSFVNLLLLSDAPERYDLSALRVLQYSTEVMPPSTLAALSARLPHVRRFQAYGMSEFGTLPSRPRDGDPRWLRPSGESMQTRIRDGLLEVRTPTAMLGYLNAPSPFTADGWLKTGDQAVYDGEDLRVLGRASSMINVGGNKLHPEEVEDILLRMEGVVDARVEGLAHAVLGQVVVASLVLDSDEPVASLRRRVRLFCSEHLPAWKVPQRVTIAEGSLVSSRLKKQR